MPKPEFKDRYVLGEGKPIVPFMTPDFVGLQEPVGTKADLNWPETDFADADCPRYRLVLERVRDDE